ncbi:MAG: hypothetical protein DRO88_12620 [Promethearchaeia archaeon]|nr:MAG: hypothetical protein DRO88_12620 [Candidatus Lokiarchaeia archaeon]
MAEFLEYVLESEALILGERIKGGIFRPSCKTLRWSTITMALRKMFGSNNIHAVGVFDSEPETSYFVYSPTERITKISKVPLQVEVLNNVKGKIYIVKNNNVNFPNEFEIFLGALISKGFGKSKLKFKEKITNPEISKGILNIRIPVKYLDKFLIKKDIMRPVYGYLFEPTSETSGVYIKSLFEGSEIVGPKFLLR